MAATQLHLLGPTPDPEQSQWFTPDWLAERVVRWAGVDGQRVVELGAGDGAFVRPLLAAGCWVSAIERDHRYEYALCRTGAQCVVIMNALAGDLVAEERDSFDAYVGNPPYEDEADLAFVLRGLELAPRVVAVLRLVFLAGKERYLRLWSKHHLARQVNLPIRPFVGAESDFAVLDIRRGPAPADHKVDVEWWTRDLAKAAPHTAELGGDSIAQGDRYVSEEDPED